MLAKDGQEVANQLSKGNQASGGGWTQWKLVRLFRVDTWMFGLIQDDRGQKHEGPGVQPSVDL